MKLLRAGGSALDAVEATIHAVESNPDDHSVGYGGLPNILGQVELDASIMDGKTLAAGAVCAVKHYEHPISIARQVMERLPHVMLAGAGAERFARELGMKKKNLLSDAARAIYENKVSDSPRYNTMRELVSRATHDPEIAASADEYGDESHRSDVTHFGTTNVIAIDDAGNFACGVSTSGWAWKYPGRVGDSPIIGAGNYCDNRYGACACTGYGEMAMRANTAHSVVLYMKMGMSLARAAREAMRDLRALTVPFPPGMNLIAVDAQGKHVGFTTETDRVVEYVYQTETMKAPRRKKRSVVPL
ncbi:MAG: N(4)-(Beta-N-acetylglucosaminyl)-L-asparaginase [Anaerolineae bacterium]|nr:N(4)-(Beta-N-acetylglucosaminyl)-L-asparaginase [Anaerolineae bacterium]